MAELRFYLDENVPLVVAEQLRRRSIDAVHVNDLGVQGDSDINHLMRASSENRVISTYDSDFVVLAQQHLDHAGIIIGKADKHWIGEWVKELILFHATYTAEEMWGRLEYLSH